MNIAAWLAAISWPLVSRVLLSAGVGTLTFVGLSAALEAALSASKTAVGGLSADLAAFLAIGGLFTAMSILAGALVTSLSLVVLKRFALQSGT